MKIAQIAPLIESVPPKYYGGTERIVSYLTEELVRQGHEVTLFASGDSRTAAELVPCSIRALRSDPAVKDPYPHYAVMLDKVRFRAEDFDILHFHIDFLHFPLFRDLAAYTLTTQHGRQDLPDLVPLYRHFRDMPLISISNAQRRPVLHANWRGTVYHGLPPELFRPTAGGGGYLAFLGRICPEKRVDRAIAVARLTGIPLRIAAKVDRADIDYYEACIRPMLSDPLVEFVGEIGEREKQDFLGNAEALLFPIDWPEPFGLVMIEAMACGTPVVAFRCGSVPEVVDEGVTGFIVGSVEEAAAAVERARALDRRAIRARFEARFTVQRMARDYVKLYNDAMVVSDMVTAVPGMAVGTRNSEAA